MTETIWLVCEQLLDDQPELVGWFDTEQNAETYITNRYKSYGNDAKYFYCWSVEVKRK